MDGGGDFLAEGNLLLLLDTATLLLLLLLLLLILVPLESCFVLFSLENSFLTTTGGKIVFVTTFLEDGGGKEEDFPANDKKPENIYKVFNIHITIQYNAILDLLERLRDSARELSG